MMEIIIRKKNIYSIVLLVIFFVGFFCLFNSISLAAQSGVDSAINGLNKAGNKGFDGDTGTDEPSTIITSIPEAVGSIVGAGLAFIGVLFFVLIIYGGLLWMTARGNETQVGKAKDLIQAAIIGLIIVLTAYAITSYVGSTLTTAN